MGSCYGKSKLKTKLIPELKKQLKNKFLRENFIIEKVLDNGFDSDRTYMCVDFLISSIM